MKNYSGSVFGFIGGVLLHLPGISDIIVTFFMGGIGALGGFCLTKFLKFVYNYFKKPENK